MEEGTVRSTVGEGLVEEGTVRSTVGEGLVEEQSEVLLVKD